MSNPIYLFGEDSPIVDFDTSPYIFDDPLGSQTTRPKFKAALLANVGFAAKNDDEVPDFNSAIIELGEPERGSEFYENLAKLYLYGYKIDGTADIFHERWSINEKSDEAKKILAELDVAAENVA